MLTDQLEKIRFGGDETPVRRVSVRSLLPDTEHYMTYEGSTTSPACHETVSITPFVIDFFNNFLYSCAGYVDSFK